MPAKPRTDAERTRYLARALQINPLQNADALLTLRREFHRLRPTQATAAVDAADVREQREVVTQQIEELRENFWTMKPAELQRTFAEVKSEPFPDLQVAVDRLKTLAQYRPALVGLTQHRHFDGDLFSSLKRVLVLSSRPAEQVREKTLKSLDTRRKLKQTQRMVALLKQKAPEVYTLEKNWLERLARAKIGAAGAESSASFEGFGLGGFGWVGGIILVILMRVVFRALLGNSSP